jgi:RimJ/RimL family protein N-acetyltransferase
MDRVRLANGTEVVIRPLRADDGERLRAAYERLSPETKYRRFLAPKPHLSSADVRYLVQVDGRNHVGLVATPVHTPDRIIAVGRFVRLAEDPEAAELAIVVGDAFQGEGLGGELLERLAREAVACGVSRLRATMLADNVPAHRLVSRLAINGVDERHVDEVDEIEVDLAA